MSSRHRISLSGKLYLIVHLSTISNKPSIHFRTRRMVLRVLSLFTIVHYHMPCAWHSILFITGIQWQPARCKIGKRKPFPRVESRAILRSLPLSELWKQKWQTCSTIQLRTLTVSKRRDHEKGHKIRNAQTMEARVRKKNETWLHYLHIRKKGSIYDRQGRKCVKERIIYSFRGRYNQERLRPSSSRPTSKRRKYFYQAEGLWPVHQCSIQSVTTRTTNRHEEKRASSCCKQETAIETSHLSKTFTLVLFTLNCIHQR